MSPSQVCILFGLLAAIVANQAEGLGQRSSAIVYRLIGIAMFVSSLLVGTRHG